MFLLAHNSSSFIRTYYVITINSFPFLWDMDVQQWTNAALEIWHASKLCRPEHEGLYCDKYCSVSPVGTVGCHDSAPLTSEDHICCHWRRAFSISGSLWHPSTMGICRWSCYLPCCCYPHIVPLVELCQGRCWDAHISNHKEDTIMSKYYLPSVTILCQHSAFVKINVSHVILGNLVCELSSTFYHDVSCLSSKGHVVELATSIL